MANERDKVKEIKDELIDRFERYEAELISRNFLENDNIDHKISNILGRLSELKSIIDHIGKHYERIADRPE